MFLLPRIQYQPTKNEQLSDAQEVLYMKEFKQADTAGGYRRRSVKEAKNENTVD